MKIESKWILFVIIIFILMAWGFDKITMQNERTNMIKHYRDRLEQLHERNENMEFYMEVDYLVENEGFITQNRTTKTIASIGIVDSCGNPISIQGGRFR